MHANKLIEKALHDPPSGEKVYDGTKILFATLSKKQDVLEKCNGDILELLTDEQEIIKEIEEATEFTDKMIEAKTKLELTIQHIERKEKLKPKTLKTESDEDEPVVKEKKIQIKLPSIQISEYNGSLLTWNVFWDKFDVAVHSRSDLADIQKYTYLKSYLTGEAKRAIQGISYDKDNYQNAIDALTARFGNKQLRISAHMKELQNVKGVQSINDVAGMRRMYDSLETKQI